MKKFILLLVAMLATTTVWAQNAPALGDLYYSDGTFSSTLIEGKTLSVSLHILAVILSVRMV